MFRGRKGFASLIELVLVLAVVSVIVYFMTNLYFKKPVVEKSLQKDLAEQGINASDPRSVVHEAEMRAEEVNKRSRELEKEAQNIEQ